MASDTARAVGAGAGGGGGGASAGSSSSADSYIGSLISLTSKSEIRYEGVLYNINTDESSIGLRQVRSFGTEGRKKDGPQIPASDKVYEYILFRGSDIKDLQVKSSPPVQPTSIHHDPAIIQSQYVHPPSTTSNLQSAGSGNVPEPSSHTTQLGLPRSPFQGSLPLYQPGGGLGSWGSAPNPPTANGSGLAMPPMYWQGYYAPSTGLPHLQQPALMRPPPGLPLPHSMQQPLQYPGLNMSLPPGSQTLPDFSPPLFAAGSSTPSLTSTSLPNTPGLTLTSLPNAPGLTSTSLPNAPGLTSGSLSVTPGLASSSVPATQAPTSSLLPSTPGLASSSLSVTLPLSSASTLAHDTSSGLLLNKSTITTVPATVGTALSSVAPLISNLESITTIPPSVPSILSSKSNTVTVPNMAYQSARQPVQPIVGSSSASQVETSAVPLATSGQLLQTAPSTLPSSQSLQTSHMHVDNKTTEAKIKPLLPDPITPPVAEAKEPILPLPKPITQKNGAPPHNHYNNRVHGRGRGNGFSRPVTKFTEEFDFTAMNEKFNKDEVWGYLGKGKGHLKDGELQEDEADEVFEEVEEEALKLEANPVYIKDDFFDSLSCNTLDRGNWNGRTKFSEQIKIDTETFGEFARHRPRGGGRGLRGGGRARGSYYGRGYGYGGRGRGFGRSI